MARKSRPTLSADQALAILSALGVDMDTVLNGAVDTPIELRTSAPNNSRKRGSAQTPAARKPKSRKPFEPKDSWKGQEPSPRMLNTCARLLADGQISKADYNRAKTDKFDCSVIIGKGFAKAGI